MSYKGFFKDRLGNDYVVMFVPSGDTSATYQELILGENPVQITYQGNSLLFSPSIISTCTIQVVSDDYLEDLMTPYAKGVSVQIYNSTQQKIVWQGYMKPQVYSQGYVNCYETIDFEASDCLASLQYQDYENINGSKKIVSFKDIIDKACDFAGVDGYYWCNSKLMPGVGHPVALPSALTISEQNFYTEDTDEPWKYGDVLDEICKYLGITLIQWENYFYFLDMQVFHANETMSMTRYDKDDDYASGSTVTLDSPVTIDADNYRGNGHSISFEPIYNKINVKANFYEPKFYTPDIDEDDYRTNRLGGSALQEIPPEVNVLWATGGKKAGNTAYTPVYIYKAKRVYDGDDSKYCYYRRLMDNKYYEPVYYTSGLTPTTPPDADLPTSRICRSYISGQLVEYGSTSRPQEGTASYELASNLSLDKYLLIHQWDMPERFRWGAAIQEHVNDYPTIFRLKSGYTNPIIFDTDSYLCIAATAKFERYQDRQYINPDWTSEPSTDADTIFSRLTTWGIVRPFLNFKLGIGGWWWNGTAWTQTETSFWVKCRTEEDEENPEIPDGGNWNQDREILNNVPFTD